MAKQSFRLVHSEDLTRPAEDFGYFEHTVESLKLLGQNWRLFLPLAFLATLFAILFSGLSSESAYESFRAALENQDYTLGNLQKSGVLLLATFTNVDSPASLGLTFLLLWLITIFILRHLLAKKSLTLRDELYQSCAPFLSALLVFLLVALETAPLVIVAISYASAVATGFLSTPFYALIYFIFAALLILLSGYLLSSGVLTLAAVSAPGLYPLEALKSAGRLASGRRLKIVLRLLFLFFALMLIWICLMLPAITIDMWLKNLLPIFANLPTVPFLTLFLSCLSFIYISAYIYLYYRRILDAEKS